MVRWKCKWWGHSTPHVINPWYEWAPVLYRSIIHVLGFHCEDGNLAWTLYLHDESLNVCYVNSPYLMCNLEKLVGRHILEPHIFRPCQWWLSRYNEESGHFYLRIIAEKKSDFVLYPPVEESGTFLYTAQSDYHFGFQSGFNFTQTVKFSHVKRREEGLATLSVSKD